MELTGNKVNGLREFANFRLDAEKRILWAGETLVDLPPRAIDVLCVLTEQPGEVFSKADLINAVWKESFVEESNLTHQIYELRKSFKEHGCEDELIQTVPRRGYRFTGKVTEIFLDKPETLVERRTISRALIEELIDHEPVVQMPSPQALAPLAIHMPQERRIFTRSLIVATLFGLVLALGYGYWRWFAGSSIKTSLADVRSIAVLPIRSIDGSTDELFETRLTDSLITKLGSLRTATVRPTSSVLRFREMTIDPIETGKLLEVDAVLTGRTQTENGRIRLNLQMISIITGEQIWAAQLDGEATRMLAFQDAVAHKLLKSLDLSADQAAAFEKQPTASSDAFEEYTRGRYFWNKRTSDGLKFAIAAYSNAVRLDPEFADAYVGLADSLFLLVDYSYDVSESNVRSANENLDKALALDPQLPAAHVTRGLIQTTYEWNWPSAEVSFRKAVDLAPRSSNAHHRYGIFLTKLGRFPEAEMHLAEARRLDPTSPSINMNLGSFYYFAQRYDQAAEQLLKAIDLDPAFSSPHWYLARCMWQQGRKRESLEKYAIASRLIGFEASAEVIEKNRNLEPEDVIKLMIPLWKERLGPQGISSHDIAKLYAAIDDRKATLYWLEKAYGQRHPWLSYAAVEPDFSKLRDEPRFLALIQKMNLK